MNDADIQRMFRQLDLILNLIQETRSAIKLLKQCGNDGADDPLIPNRQLAEILDVRTKQIIEYRKKKLIEAVIIQNRVFFRKSAVKKFIEEHINKGDRSYGKQCYERVRKYRNVVIDRKKSIKLLNRPMPTGIYADTFRCNMLRQENKVRPDTRGRMRNLGDRLYCI